MKTVKVLTAAAMALMLTGTVYAVETEQESKSAVANDAKRTTDKTVNRIKEAVCMKSDTQCLKEKAQHRVEEATDAVKDKASEIKNNVDN